MEVQVIGGTGNVGRQLVRDLTAQGQAARVFPRSAAAADLRAARWPAEAFAT